MAKAPEPPIDRFLLAALADRLIYGSETVFDPDDARALLAALPRRRSPRFEIGIMGKMRDLGSLRGFAAGIGSAKVEDDKERPFSYSTAQDAIVRAGQWKLLWIRNRRGQYVEIEQVMADPTEDGRGARVRYDPGNEPVAMDIRSNRAFRLLNVTLVFPGWTPWKTPGPDPAA